MNTGEVKLRDAGARQRGQGARAARSALVNQVTKASISGFIRDEGGASKCTSRS
jgi:hypothetical protein